MKKIISIFLVLLICLFPFNAYAADYGSYCSDDVSYPNSDIPALTITNNSAVNFVIYNSLDHCYYFVKTYPYAGSSSYSCSVFVNSSNYLACTLKKANFYVYKYDPSNSNSWVQIFYDYADANVWTWTVCQLSENFKFKFLYCSSDFVYSDNGYDFNVKKTNSNLGLYDIYANFYDPSGVYLNNDPSVNGSGGGGSSESVTVDLTQTNNILISIRDKLDSLTTDITAVKTNINSLLTKFDAIDDLISPIKSKVDLIQSDIAAVKLNVASVSASVSEGGYIASRINTIQSDIATIKTNTGNLNNVLGDSGYIGSRVNTISSNLSNLISVLSTKLDSINDNLSLINEDLTRQANSEPNTTIFRTVGDFYSSFNSFSNYFSNYFIDMWAEAMSLIYGAMSTFYTDTFPGFVSHLDDKFTALENVIIYGNEEGVDDTEEEMQNITAISEGFTSVTGSLDGASDVVDSAATGVSAYIQTFTDFYNGLTALHVGINAAFIFAVVLIFVKKVIGR